MSDSVIFITTIAVCATLALFAVLQAAFATGLIVRLRSPATPLPTDAACPPAAIVLCLRGADPFLARTLDAILDQDYPNYLVRIVVDRPDDPVWPLVRAAGERLRGEGVDWLADSLIERRTTCGLKCASLIQAYDSLPATIQVVALLDADTIPHRTWLRELVGALGPDDVGAATGQRWYMPGDPTTAALVRYLWNVAAVVQMFGWRIAWGGSLALKRTVIERARLNERWGEALCEDTMLRAQLAPLGLRTAFVPTLMMVNRESCDLGGFFRWVRRQLLVARLYHPAWLLVLLHGLSTSLTLAAGTVGAVVAWFTGKEFAAAALAGGVIGYQLTMALFLGLLESSVRRVVRRRGEPAEWLTGAGAVRAVGAIPLTQLIYSAALCSAATLKQVDWRGIEYRIDGPWRIRRLNDSQAETTGDKGTHSL